MRLVDRVKKSGVGESMCLVGKVKKLGFYLCGKTLEGFEQRKVVIWLTFFFPTSLKQHPSLAPSGSPPLETLWCVAGCKWAYTIGGHLWWWFSLYLMFSRFIHTAKRIRAPFLWMGIWCFVYPLISGWTFGCFSSMFLQYEQCSDLLFQRIILIVVLKINPKGASLRQEEKPGSSHRDPGEGCQCLTL